MEYLLETHGLTKVVKGKTLVSDLHMHVPKGKIYGFLGPNGAGKTTTMKMLTNLWKPTSGEIQIFGELLTEHSYEMLRRMGSIIEFPTFYEHLSVQENLKLHCEYMGYYSPDCIMDSLQLFGLADHKDKKASECSLGMKQRLGIARAVLTRPELLILDEPTNGLDPAGMKQVRDILQMLSTEYGITILISTHILSEIESIADVIGVIRDGKMQQEITMKEIHENGLEYVEMEVSDLKKASYLLADRFAQAKFKIMENNRIRVYGGSLTAGQITKVFAMENVEIVEIRQKSESLEDYFLRMTGEVK